MIWGRSCSDMLKLFFVMMIKLMIGIVENLVTLHKAWSNRGFINFNKSYLGNNLRSYINKILRGLLIEIQ